MKYIILILIISINSLAFPNENNEDALREARDNLGQAIYKKYNGDIYAKRIAEIILDKNYWKYVTPTVKFGRMVVERRVIYKYEF